MADRGEIEELFHRYEWGLDAPDVAYVRDSFTDDSVFSMDVVGEQAIEPIHGGQTIAELIGSVLAEQTTEQRRHLVTNLRLEDRQESSATAIAYLTLIITEGGELRVQCTGLYTTNVVREGDTWRFAKMHLSLDRPEEDDDPLLSHIGKPGAGS